jgi:hypothetical protein
MAQNSIGRSLVIIIFHINYDSIYIASPKPMQRVTRVLAKR